MSLWRSNRHVDVFSHNVLVLRHMLALMRDTAKMVALGRGAPTFSKAQIQVYSPAGEGVLLFSVCVDTPSFSF